MVLAGPMRDDDELLSTPGLEFGSGVVGICDICHRRQAVIVLSKERYQLCVIDFLNKTFQNSKEKPGRPLPLYRSERIWFATDATSEGKAPAIVLSPTKAVKRPSILITPDIYGLTTTLLDAAIRFARDGFEVMLPDVGKTSSVGPADHISLRIGGRFGGGVALDSPRVRRLVGLYRDALKQLRSRDLVETGKGALFGTSFGASLAIALAGEDRGLSAVALAYPMPVRPPDFVNLVGAPLLVVTGANDRRATSSRRPFPTPSATVPSGVEYFDVPEVGHNFLARDLSAYDVAAAEAAWSRVSIFLKAKLLPAPPKAPLRPPTPPSTAAPAAPAAPTPSTGGKAPAPA